jgi:hypothetical protein
MTGAGLEPAVPDEYEQAYYFSSTTTFAQLTFKSHARTVKLHNVQQVCAFP